MDPTTDQDDIIAHNERLTAELATTRQTLSGLQTEAQALRTENTALKSSLETVRGENATLKAQLSDARQRQIATQEALTACTKERDAFKANNEGLNTKLTDFEKAVAAKVTQMGFAKQAASQALPPADGTRNYTEECRAARGLTAQTHQ